MVSIANVQGLSDGNQILGTFPNLIQSEIIFQGKTNIFSVGFPRSFFVKLFFYHKKRISRKVTEFQDILYVKTYIVPSNP